MKSGASGGEFKTKKHHSLFVFIVAAWYINHAEGQGCYKFLGPSGSVKCIKVSGFSGYQWATCRTEAFVQSISNGKHHCLDRSAIYCYYQCMLEVYSQKGGTVLPRCSCTPGSQPTQDVKLPSRCFSPSGTNCTWYQDCLSKTYPSCNEDNDNDYGIKFGEKFCELANEMNLTISDQATQWVDAVRKCLQIKQVPLLGQTRVQTCRELKFNTFKTHAPCYSNPDIDSTLLSLCSLSSLEQLRVFWTIKSEFPGQTFWPSLKSMLDEIRGCIRPSNSRVQEVKDNIEEKVRNNAGKPEIEVRIKAWLEDPIPPIQLDIFIRDGDWPITGRSYFAGKVVDALALNQNWKGVTFFAYFRESYSGSKSIRLLVADRSRYEIPGAYGKNTSTQPANMTALFLQLSKDVKNNLTLQVNGKSVQIRAIQGCLDSWDCKKLAFAAVSEADLDVKLPSRCFSLSGTDCTWYQDCLRKTYHPSCNENNDNDYGIKFGETFCELSNEKNLNISDQGKRWVDEVGKCLQIKQVPRLGQTRVQNCGELKFNTLKTHLPCYSNPDSTSLSLCSLSSLEQLKVFWTIKSAFPRQTFWPSLKYMLHGIVRCIRPTNSRVREVKNNIEKKVRDNAGKPALETAVRINAWLEDPIPPIQLEMFIRDEDWPSTKRSYFAGKVVDAMALKQMWKEVAWFAFNVNGKTIRMFVADRSKYETLGAFGKTSSTEPADIAALLLQLSKDVYNGTLNLQVSGDSVQIVRIRGCLDWHCTELAFEEKSQIIHERNAAESHKARGTFLFPLFGFFVTNFLFMT